MFFDAPLVKAKQNRAVLVEELPEIIMLRFRSGQTKQRLIPSKALGHVRDTDDCPQALHGDPPKSFVRRPSMVPLREADTACRTRIASLVEMTGTSNRTKRLYSIAPQSRRLRWSSRSWSGKKPRLQPRPPPSSPS